MKLEEAIRQKQFKDEFLKADIHIMYMASWLSMQKKKWLKPFGISWQQFNLLRILRGQHPKPAPLKLLTERMIDQMSNTSRLVEKLRVKGLVKRSTCSDDRRRLDIVITEQGLELLREASEVMESNIRRIFHHLDEKEAQQLNHLLDKIRNPN